MTARHEAGVARPDIVAVPVGVEGARWGTRRWEGCGSECSSGRRSRCWPLWCRWPCSRRAAPPTTTPRARSRHRARPARGDHAGRLRAEAGARRLRARSRPATTLEHPDTKVVAPAVRRPREAPWRRYRKSSAEGDAPDVFLMDHDDLDRALGERRRSAGSTTCWPQREVDFGDGYTRNGLEAFSVDAALQCMPQDVSPLVVYFNPRLIELDRIAEPGARPVDPAGRLVTRGVRPRCAAAAPPGVRGLLHRPRPRADRPVRLVRGWRGRRRHRRADDAHPLGGSVGRRDGGAAGAGARPRPDLQPGCAAQEVGTRAVQGRQARDDPGLPQPDA